jgi:hypothetical protein
MKDKKDKSGMPPITNKRIYCILANTVQAPLDDLTVVNPVTEKEYVKLVTTPETKTTLQPAGRIMAQQGHVVSRVRDIMFKKALVKNWDKLKKDSVVFDTYCDPITTINLSVRDSFELHHVFQLLDHAGILVHEFKDFNQPDYGSAELEVRTAIATEPVSPEMVVGILDYLPLWTPNPWDMSEKT